MADTFRALCAELVDIIIAHANPDDYAVGYVAETLTRARTALAEEPAVPDGKEPAAVTGQPSDEEWRTGLPPFAGFYYVRGLLDESIGGDNRPVYVNPKHFVWGFWEQDDPEFIGLDSDITPENIQWKPVALPLAPPADGEVAELVEWLEEESDDYACLGNTDAAAKLNRAAELLQRQELVPVSISERLPEPEDCDAEGRCWFGTPSDNVWGANWVLRKRSHKGNGISSWHPAHALPIPLCRRMPSD